MNLEQYVEQNTFDRIKQYKFSDTVKLVIGMNNYSNIKNLLYEKLVTNRIADNKEVSKIYVLLKNYEQTPYYSWAVDAIAQNISSLPFIFNDKYSPLKYLFTVLFNYDMPPDNEWSTAWATRGNAFIGNAIIGDAYRVWQDYLESYLDTKLHISTEKNKFKKIVKTGIADTTAFITGQSWIYAGFLFGGNIWSGKETNYETLAMGVISLSVFAPIIGPWTSKVYKSLRKKMNLPPKTEFS
jgi:hypothetical protein